MASATDVKEFYSKDIVYRYNKQKRLMFGVVIESYEACVDPDEYYALQKGQIRVLWSNKSHPQVWRQDRVRLMSRNIIPGDIVRRLEHGKETQRGYCKEAKQYATVQVIGTHKIIEKIPGARLKTINEYEIDTAACLGSRYGRIQVVYNISCAPLIKVLSFIYDKTYIALFKN